MHGNTGQTCVALTRMLVPRTRYDEAVGVAAAAADAIAVGDPSDPTTAMGRYATSRIRACLTPS
ncbi:aldehyde dehydrogenase family protein [Cupriavidus necator]|nr:aldehyde dehydrogenase family protein [Cupriavidus necator]MDX6007841.1 aldehyde dehydrogenase family protein [Cupriavidus necator]